jgi:hypothetical protein
MGPTGERQDRAVPTTALSPEERRWLHDKYERLIAEEADLSASRTSYYAAIGTVLITGFVVSIADMFGHPTLLVTIVSFLAVLGIVISIIWAVLLHRTNDAQQLYREAALRLEESEPPLTGALTVPITLRSGKTMDVDLLRPFQTHERRFAKSAEISWMDRVNPTTMTELLPLVFIGIWVAAAIGIWTWFLFFQ